LVRLRCCVLEVLIRSQILIIIKVIWGSSAYTSNIRCYSWSQVISSSIFRIVPSRSISLRVDEFLIVEQVLARMIWVTWSIHLIHRMLSNEVAGPIFSSHGSFFVDSNAHLLQVVNIINVKVWCMLLNGFLT